MPRPQTLGYTLGKSLESGILLLRLRLPSRLFTVQWRDNTFCYKKILIRIFLETGLTKVELDKFLPRDIAGLQKSSHPNILDFYQIVETDEMCFIAYELEDNGTIMEYINLGFTFLNRKLASFSAKCVKFCPIAIL